jgi:hypothetical protein
VPNWVRSAAGCPAVPLSAFLDIGPLIGSDNANAILTLLAAPVHGYIALGWRNIVAFSLITIGISIASEVIGVATGWGAAWIIETPR